MLTGGARDKHDATEQVAEYRKDLWPHRLLLQLSRVELFSGY